MLGCLLKIQVMLNCGQDLPHVLGPFWCCVQFFYPKGRLIIFPPVSVAIILKILGIFLSRDLEQNLAEFKQIELTIPSEPALG